MTHLSVQKIEAHLLEQPRSLMLLVPHVTPRFCWSFFAFRLMGIVMDEFCRVLETKAELKSKFFRKEDLLKGAEEIFWTST